MAAINFAKSDRSYEKFIQFSHIIAAGFCAALLLFTIFHSSHFVFTPPIFMASAFVFGVDAYDTVRGNERSKKRTARFVFNFAMTAFCISLAVLSIMCFWVI